MRDELAMYRNTIHKIDIRDVIGEFALPVNANRSGTRLLAVLEQIARSQPIGVRQLAREMSMDKSAAQRAVATLAEAGWLQPASHAARGWELSARILHIAHLAHGSNSLRLRARPVLNALRDLTGETAYLTIPDVDGFIVVEAAESHQALRMVVPVGSCLPTVNTASIGSALPYLPADQQEQLLIGLSDEERIAALRKPPSPTYRVGQDLRDSNSIAIAAPVFGVDGNAIGAIAICAVRLRTGEPEQERIGALLLEKARELSYFGSAELNPAALRKAIGGFG